MGGKAGLPLTGNFPPGVMIMPESTCPCRYRKKQHVQIHHQHEEAVVHLCRRAFVKGLRLHPMWDDIPNDYLIYTW